MAVARGLTDWTDLTTRRQTILKTAEDEFGDDTFARGELNRHLSEPTTTQTLNKIAQEDGYLRRFPGGSSMLLALNPTDRDRTAFGPAQEEDLAKRMVRQEGLPLDAESVNWADNDDRESFVDQFNKLSVTVDLEATWTRNKYRLKDEARAIIRRN